MRYAEIEIRGHLTFHSPDPEARAFLAAAAEADRRPDYGVIRAEDVAAQLAALAAQGVGAVLIRYASAGGANGAAQILCDALRRFRAAGGKVVSFVEVAGSTAVDPALEGDVVLMDPGGKFMVHGSLRPEGVDDREAAERRETTLRRSLEQIAARTATPRDMAREWLSTYEDEHAVNVVELVYRDALNFGWADCSVTLEMARMMVECVADGGHVSSPRAALLASRAAGGDAAQTLFGQTLATCSQPGRRAYPRKRRALPAATGVGCSIHNVGNSVVGVRHLATAPSDNLVPNGNSDATPPTGGWPVGSLEQAGRTNYPGAAYQGTYCRKVEALSTSIATLTVTPVISIAEGENVYAEAMIAPEATATNNGSTLLCGRMVVAWINASGSEFAWSFKDPTTSGSYGKVAISATAPSGATAMTLRFEVLGQVKIAYLDNIVLRKTPPVVTGGVSYATGWGNYGGYTPPNVRASPGGVGVLTGLCTASAGATSSMFTLPAEVRPLVSGYFPVRHTRSGTISMLWAHGSASTGLIGALSVAPVAGDLVEFYWTFPVA
jgi:hypothetical protein